MVKREGGGGLGEGSGDKVPLSTPSYMYTYNCTDMQFFVQCIQLEG